VRIVVLHAGGLGDLVLIEALLAALRDRYPEARIELVCRADAAPVVALHPRPPDAVHPFAFDPYRWALPDDGVALQARTLLPRLEGPPVDLFISAELRATWLSEILAAALAPGDAAIADPTRPAGSDLSILLGKLRLGRNRAVRRGVGAAGTPHELERYARLAGMDGMRIPQLRRPDDRASSGELAVFPISAGALNRWRIADLAEAARSIAAAHGLTPVLFGSADDGADLEAALASGGFGPNARIATGSPADLPEIAARIAAASGYVGVDTGLAHLAAAYGLPGVTVYGGGTWPRYAPWGPRSAGVVAPIPCFGCGWDCAFERPFCIEGVDVASVVAAFAAAYLGDIGGPAVRELGPYGPREREIFAAAAQVHRAAQRDRAERLSAITRLRDLLVRYARRAGTRRRRSDAQLASLAQATTSAAQRLESVRQGSSAEPPIPGEAQPSGARLS
jgi:ADP-heptose:LPS heptosyltransferase